MKLFLNGTTRTDKLEREVERMDAKKCDICGKLYEEKPASLVQDFEDAVNELLPFITSKDILNKLRGIVDICPECSDALFETIDNLRGKKK